MSGDAIRQAVILAGGKGTRLGAITQTIPKPMLPIAGDRPFLDYLLETIERHGYHDILLLGGYLGDVLERAYDGRRIGNAMIRVLREPAPLGTAGALTIARESLDPRFLLMNGDAFFDINLRALEQASQQSGAMATLALRSVPDAARYGRVIEEQGSVVAFLEKDLSRPGPGVINGGIYVLRREILDLIQELPCSLEQDIFPALVERGQIRGREFDGYFLDIGLPETLERGRLELPSVRLRPAVFIDADALIQSTDANFEAFRWGRGAVEAIRELNDRGYYVFVSHHLAAHDAVRLSDVMQQHLAGEGAHVDAFYGEAAGPTNIAPGHAIAAAKSKPVFGPIVNALNEWPIVRERSLFIGGSGDEIQAARGAGVSSHAVPEGDLASLVHSLLTQSLQD
jgi:dTDP-glucose pyrophosphorylase/histidinol phosphatase-like enzyme